MNFKTKIVDLVDGAPVSFDAEISAAEEQKQREAEAEKARQEAEAAAAKVARTRVVVEV